MNQDSSVLWLLSHLETSSEFQTDGREDCSNKFQRWVTVGMIQRLCPPSWSLPWSSLLPIHHALSICPPPGLSDLLFCLWGKVNLAWDVSQIPPLLRYSVRYFVSETRKVTETEAMNHVQVNVCLYKSYTVKCGRGDYLSTCANVLPGAQETWQPAKHDIARRTPELISSKKVNLEIA